MSTHRLQVTQALYWEFASILWMIGEAAFALDAGWKAHSLVLTGFGADSLIELLSAVILFWRLRVEARGASDDTVERAERTAAWGSAGLLALLALYLLSATLWEMASHIPVQPSGLGVVVTAVSGVVMIGFARRKQQLGTALNSAALKSDAVESWTCAYMAWTGLLGTLGVWAFGWTWVDPLAALILTYWVSREGWHAFIEARESQ
ncbi:cation transporter [Alicyclobacillaceae bacterium I2511]|nr:cation transporter [Alicyclobacillaceae bacterium I2511]